MDPFSTTAFLISVTAGVLGNRSDDWLCKSYNNLLKYITTTKEPANQEIQCAVRRAYLKATLLTCKSLKKNKYKSHIITPKYLSDINSYLRQEIKKLDKDETFVPTSDFDSNFETLLQPKGVSANGRLPELILTLKQSILRSLEVPPFEAKDELKNYILEGWEENGKHIDWYELMCAFFQEELKNNPHLSTIIQTNLLTKLNQDISGIQLSLADFMKPLQDFFEEYKGILPILDEINEKLDELPTEIQRIVREELQNTQLETLPRFDLDSQYKKMNQDIQNFAAKLAEIQQEIEDTQADIQDLQDGERKTRKERNLQRLFKNQLETSVKKNQLTQNRDNFIKDIIKIAASLPKQPINNERLKKAKAYLDSGNLSKAIAAFNEPEMNQELQTLLTEKEENQQKLKNTSNEYLMLARLTATNYNFGKKRYETAKKYFEQSLKANRNVDNIFSFAVFLQRNNQLLKASLLYEEQVIIYRRLNEENPKIYLQILGRILNNLGETYRLKNEFKKAESIYKEALKIFRQLVLINPQIYLPDLAALLNNLGILYQNKNYYNQAEEVYKEALEINRQASKVNPQKHLPNVADILNNLGNLYQNKNNYEYAKNAYDEALPILRRLAKVNPQKYLQHVAETLNNLGLLYWAKNNYELAKRAYYEALKIYQQLAQINPGNYLSHLAATSVNLANSLNSKDDYNLAEQANQRALSIYRQLAQVNPQTYLPYVATTLHNLGIFLIDKKQFLKAEKAHQEALAIRKKRAESFPQFYEIDLSDSYLALSILYCYYLLDKEKSLENAEEALVIYDKYPHVPRAQKLKRTAQKVIDYWKNKKS